MRKSRLMGAWASPQQFEQNQAAATVNEPTAVLIQESLGQIGIKATIKNIPGSNFRTELNKKVLPLYLNVFSGWLDYPEYFFIWCYHGKNSIFNTMSYQSKEMDAMIDGAVDAAAIGDKAKYEKDVKGFVDLAFSDLPRHPACSSLIPTSRCRRIFPATISSRWRRSRSGSEGQSDNSKWVIARRAS